MKTTFLKQAVLGAVFALGSVAANAASITLDLNYMATNYKGDFATASGGTAISVGTITLTDLSDLNLGDGATGVRSVISLTGLNQFSSGTGSIFISSYMLNFAGTEVATNDNFRNVSGLSTSGIEFEEDGCIGSGSACAAIPAPVLGNIGWGGTRFDPAFGQEINFTAGTFVNGQISAIDFLNNDDFSGFSVEALLANSVINNDPAYDLPNALAAIKIRSTGLGIAANGDNWWGTPVANAAGGRLNVLAVVTPVPEPESYAMFLAGLTMLGFTARRRYKL
jgi:hypothetical protein